MDDLHTITGREPEAPSFISINRSKRALAIDVRHEQGREVILRLAKDADVAIECFRPGVMDRLAWGIGSYPR